MIASNKMSMEIKRRKVISSESRGIIANVYHYLKQEYRFTLATKEPNCDVSHLRNVSKRTADATGVSIKTVLRILKEQKELPSTSSDFTSPMKRRRKRDNKIKIDSFTTDVVRSTIQNFYIVHKEVPTLAKIKSALNERIGFDGCRETLRTLLRKLGYEWRKTDHHRKVLTENHDIQMRRLKYLRKLAEYRAQGRPIVYTDECDVLSTHVRSNVRYILIHAGTKDGFIENASLISMAKEVTGDNPSIISYEIYEKWLNEQLLPNLPQGAVIILDNASYHNTRAEKRPNSTSNIEDMQQWLCEKGIQYAQTLVKTELYDNIINHKDHNIIYKIDYFIKSQGFEVLRLPPNHPELNVIEHIWGNIKYNIASMNVKENMANIESLINDSVEQVTNETWLNACNHVEKLEKEYMRFFEQ